MEFESKEECVFALQKYHIKHFIDYYFYNFGSKRYIINYRNKDCTFKCLASLGKGSG